MNPFSLEEYADRVRAAREALDARGLAALLVFAQESHYYLFGYDGDAEQMIRERDALVPMGHMGDAWDVARAALFLASDEAKYITGIQLVVDGGISCKMG